MTPVLFGAVALVLSLALTPMARRFAVVVGMTDAPGPRRIHQRPVARAGGLGVALSVVLACAACGGLPPSIHVLVVVGGALLVAVGLADDVLSLSPRVKLVGQVAAGALAVAGGLRFGLLAPAGVGGLLGTLDAAVTVFWIVFVTNAVNLTDGLDGLAGGIGVVAFSWLACAALRTGDVSGAVVPAAMTGALLGFLAYNFNPASIFLGDAGSLLIGYVMAVLPLVGIQGSAVSPLAAFLLVAVPVTDTLLAIARRFLFRCISAWGDGRFWFGIKDGLRNTVAPDRRHIHHRLLDLGFTQRRAVLMLYLAAGTTGALGYLVIASAAWPVDLFAVGFGICVITVVQSLGFDELRPARSGVALPLLRRVARHRWLLVAADACLVIGMYGGALLMANGLAGSGSGTAVAAAMLLMASVQLVAFLILGVYRTSWRSSGVSGFGLLARACAVATVTGYMGLRLVGLPISAPAAIVYFSLFLSAVTLMRLSYVLLAQAAQRAVPAERTLICGTATGARHALAHLRQAGVGNLMPVGLVALRDRLQGRQVDQLPVLGTLDVLPSIIREQRATHLVIADPALRGERAAWLRAVCRQFGVGVHRYVEKLVSYDEPVDGLDAPTTDTASAFLGDLFEEVGIDEQALSVAASVIRKRNGVDEISIGGEANGTNS